MTKRYNKGCNNRDLIRKYQKENYDKNAILHIDFKSFFKEEKEDLKKEKQETKSFQKLLAALDYSIRTIEQYINYVDELKEKEMQEDEIELTEMYYIIKEKINIFKIIYKELMNYTSKEIENKKVFTSFWILCNILDTSIQYITEEEKFNIILYLIEQNIELIKKQKEKKTTETHTIEKMILLQNNANEEFSYNTSDIEEIIQDSNFYNCFDSAIKTIEEKYLRNKNTYTQEDINIILNAFRNLQITESIIKSIEQILRKNLRNRNQEQKRQRKIEEKNKRNVSIKKKAIEVSEDGKIKLNPFSLNNKQRKDENNKPITMRPFFTATIQKNTITKVISQKRKTLQEIKKELKNYIDIYNFEIKKYLLPSEIYYISELLTDLESEKKEINTFITGALLKLTQEIQKSNLRTLRQIFAENREKYYFYYETKGYIQLEKHIKYLEEAFDLLATEKEESTIEYFEKDIRNELLILEYNCPATHEYEFRKLDKYKQKKKY